MKKLTLICILTFTMLQCKTMVKKTSNLDEINSVEYLQCVQKRIEIDHEYYPKPSLERYRYIQQFCYDYLKAAGVLR